MTTISSKITISDKIAIERSLDEAYLIDCLFTQLNANTNDGLNIQDGKVWAALSIKEWEVKVRCLSARKLQRLFKLLAEDCLIEVCNKNKNRFDQTLWYAFTTDGLDYIENAGYDVSHIRRCGKSTNANANKNEAADDTEVKETKQDNIVKETQRFHDEIYADSQYIEKFGQHHVDSFFDYYSQQAENNGRKLKHILRYTQKSWDVGKRLARWTPPKVTAIPVPSQTELQVQAKKLVVSVSEDDRRIFDDIKKKTIKSMWALAPQIVEVTDNEVIIQMPTRAANEAFCNAGEGKIFYLSIKRQFNNRNVRVVYNEYDTDKTG